MKKERESFYFTCYCYMYVRNTYNRRRLYTNDYPYGVTIRPTKTWPLHNSKVTRTHASNASSYSRKVRLCPSRLPTSLPRPFFLLRCFTTRLPPVPLSLVRVSALSGTHVASLRSWRVNTSSCETRRRELFRIRSRLLWIPSLIPRLKWSINFRKRKFRK